MQPNFLILLIQRIKSEQPEFYKKLQNIALIVLLLDGFIYAGNWFGLFSITAEQHDKINTACYFVATFIVAVFFTSLTGTKDPKLISNDAKDAIIKDAKEQ